MAYVFDPTTNTLIDDEDKSLGNKLALLDSDLEAAIQSLNEKFGPGTVQQGTQGIPQPPIKTPQAIFEFEERMKGRMADGGMIGGGVISGEDYGDRTGFVEPKFVEGGNRTPSEFRNKFGVRTNLTVPADTPGYLGRSGERAIFKTETDAQRFIDEDIEKLLKGREQKRSPILEARLEKIKNIYKDLKASGQKKIYLDDIIDQLKGEKTVFGTGKRRIQTEQTEIKSRKSFIGNIKEALGKKIYDSLIKAQSTDPRITDAKKIKFNKLVLDVNRGDLPILDLGQEGRGTKTNIKQYLTEANKKRFDKLLPKLRAINSRVGQPRQRYEGTDAIVEISNTTTKNFNKIIKKYPSSQLEKGNLLKSGQSFNAKSYILSQIDRHVGEGGKLYRHVSGDTHKNIKFRNINTNKLITYNNIDLINPEFKEAADVYEQWKKLKDLKIDDPRNPGKTITLNKALKEGGDFLVKDHLDPEGVKGNPLKNLVISTQKTNMSGQIKNLTPEEIAAIGRGQNLSFVDNVKRYKKYAERILTKKIADPEFKIKSPTDTIKEKAGTFRGEAQSLKSKMDNFRFLSNKVPGGAVVLSPVDFTLSMFAGLPLTESLASAGSYLLKDPLIGKTVNVPLAIAADMQDPEGMMERAGKRKEKFKNVLEGITGIDQDEPLLDELREKFSNMEAGDQPDIDPFQAAEGGRVGFNNGGAAGADENFAAELEYFLTNPEVELPKMQTYKETMNPIESLNDIIDPRNYPYYADVLVRSGVRIGEFATRILPATGKLINDLITKPAFKIERPSEGVSKKSNYVQDYTDVLPVNIKGTGIFSEFLKNITPTSLEKKIGLDKLIEKEEQKQKDRGSTVGPKVFADTVGLGAEVTAPIFPGLKVAQKVLKPKKIAAAVENRKTDAPEIPNKIPELDSIENLELNLAILRNRAKNPDAPVEEVTRVLVRKLLDKKGIQYGNNDPVDVYMDIYGDIILDVKNLAEEIVDGIQAGRNFKSIDDLLRIEGLDDIPIPKEPNPGIPTEDVIEMLEKDLRKKKQLNAKGGIIK